MGITDFSRATDCSAWIVSLDSVSCGFDVSWVSYSFGICFDFANKVFVEMSQWVWLSWFLAEHVSNDINILASWYYLLRIHDFLLRWVKVHMNKFAFKVVQGLSLVVVFWFGLSFYTVHTVCVHQVVFYCYCVLAAGGCRFHLQLVFDFCAVFQLWLLCSFSNCFLHCTQFPQLDMSMDLNGHWLFEIRMDLECFFGYSYVFSSGLIVYFNK